jgi:hypothetical protein
MIQILYPVFEIEGEEYVADVNIVLTSDPPQYNAYRLSDKKHVHVKCLDTNGNRFMYAYDFWEFMNGKTQSSMQVATLTGDVILVGPQPAIQVAPVTHPRPLTMEEKFEALEKEVKSLRKQVARLKAKY